MVQEISSPGEYKGVLKKEQLIVLDCYATWCGPCKVMSPKVQQFSEQFPDAYFYKINVDKVANVAQELKVRTIPTFFLFKNSEKVGEIVGANPNALKAATEKLIW